MPNLAAGNLLGSNMFNMFLLAILDLLHRKQRILRNAALKHALTGSLTVFMIGLVVFFIMADIHAQVGWVGLDSMVIMLVYVVASALDPGQPDPHQQSAAQVERKSRRDAQPCGAG